MSGSSVSSKKSRFAFLRRPEPWPWLGVTVGLALAGALERVYSATWPFVVGTLILLTVTVVFFVAGIRLRLRGLRELEKADVEGAFIRDAGKAILDTRIVALVEASLAGLIVGILIVPPNYVVVLVEVVVLVFTAVLVYLTAVYTSTSLGYFTEKSIQENRSAQVTSSAAIVEAIRTVRESGEAGNRMVAAEVASLKGEMKDAEERRRSREKELAAAAAAQAERERLAVLPKLDAKLEIVGGPLHSVMLSISNSGMDAFNLTVRIDGRSPPNPAILIGRVGHGETKKLNLGDVGVFPWDRVVSVVVRCSAFDVAGRPLEQTWTFRYLRSTGLFGVTTGWDIQKVG